MTDLDWGFLEDVSELVCLFGPVSISGRPPGVVSCDRVSRLPSTPFVANIPGGNGFWSSGCTTKCFHASGGFVNGQAFMGKPKQVKDNLKIWLLPQFMPDKNN